MVLNNLQKNKCEKIPGYKGISVLGYEIFSGKLDIIKECNEKLLINTISPNSYGIALKDKSFEKSLKNSDLLVMDGMGMAIGSILIHGKNINKISGQDCFDFLMDLAEKNYWKVFFLGSTEITLQKIKNRVLTEFQNIQVGYHSPPFKAEFDLEDNIHMVSLINQFEPDVLFVGMTAPKQEKWAYENRENINVKIISTIGNVFDWYAGNSKRPAKIWIKLRLEWLIRIFHRPEIFKRNTGNQLKFLRDIFLHLFPKKLNS